MYTQYQTQQFLLMKHVKEYFETTDTIRYLEANLRDNTLKNMFGRPKTFLVDHKNVFGRPKKCWSTKKSVWSTRKFFSRPKTFFYSTKTFFGRPKKCLVDQTKFWSAMGFCTKIATLRYMYFWWRHL